MIKSTGEKLSQALLAWPHRRWIQNAEFSCRGGRWGESKQTHEGGSASESSQNDEVLLMLELRLQTGKENVMEEVATHVEKEEIFPKWAVGTQLSFHHSVTLSAEHGQKVRPC